MGGWNAHYKFNQYKVKLNEVFDNLDEIIYLSSTIDYKKVNILLFKIVQNFDYYHYYIPPPQPEIPDTSVITQIPEQVPEQIPEQKKRVYGGRKGRGGRGFNFSLTRGRAPPSVSPEQPEQQEVSPEQQEVSPEQQEVSPEQPEISPEQPEQQEVSPEQPDALAIPAQVIPKEQPYSSIDTNEMIDIIMKDQEYQDLIAYIDGVQTNIRRKCGSLMEIITPLTEFLNDKTIENRLILQDYLKQHEVIKTKLTTIQDNIRDINYGIHRKYKIPPRKIKFDVILIPNTIEWDIFKYFLNSATRYHFNRYFYTKQIHVVKGDLSKETIEDFENKLKILYNDLFIKFNEYIRENKNDKEAIVDKLNDSQADTDALADATDPYNPGAVEDDPDTQPIQTLLTMLEEKRGSVSKLFVKPQQSPMQPQMRPQQPYNPSQPQMLPSQPQSRPQSPQPYIQQPQAPPKEPILNQLTEEITDKIKNKTDTAKQDLIDSTKNVKDGVASFITGLSTKDKLGNVQDAKEGVTSFMKGLTDNIPDKSKFTDLAKGNLGDLSSMMDGKIPDLANAKGKLGDLAKGKLGDLSSMMDGKMPPDLANAKGKFTDLAKGKLGDLSSMMDGKMPDLTNAKGKLGDLAKGKLGDLSSMMEGKMPPDLTNAKGKFTDLAKGKLGDLSSMMEGKMPPDLANAKGKLGDLAKGKLGDLSSRFKNNNSKITNLAKDKFKALVP
jgi:hypothetical protein